MFNIPSFFGFRTNAVGIFAAYAVRVAADGGVTESGSCVDAVSGLSLDGSLLLIPSGYKAGTVYCEIPTDGSGDLSFTRALDTATRVGPNGLIEGMLANVPRLDYTGGGCPKLLLESQRTNLAFFSDEFDNAYWLKSGGTTVTANTTISPDGFLNADTIAFAGSNDSLNKNITTGLSVVSGTTYTISIFTKTQAQIIFFGGATGGTGTNVFNGSVDFGNGYFRQSITRTWSASGTVQVQFIIFTGTAGSSVIAYGCQAELGSFASSYIPTLGAAVTRSADAASKQNIAGILPTAYPFTLYAEGFLREIDDVLLSINQISEFNVFYQIGATANGFFANARNNTASFISTASGRSIGTHKVAAVFTSAEIRLFANGALIATGANAQTFNVNANDLLLGQLRVTSDIGKRSSVNQALVFKSALTDAQCIQLTT